MFTKGLIYCWPDVLQAVEGLGRNGNLKVLVLLVLWQVGVDEDFWVGVEPDEWGSVVAELSVHDRSCPPGGIHEDLSLLGLDAEP